MKRIGEDIKFNIKNTDFVRRKRHGRISYIAGMFVAGIVSSMWVAFNPDLVADRGGYVALFIGCLVAPLLYTLYIMHRNLNLVMGVEFQNALFTSAMSDKNSFTVIINQEGGVLFNDPELSNFFPNIALDGFVDSLVSIAGLSHAEVERLYYALVNGQKEHFTFSHKWKDEETSLVRVTFKPLRRPKGYFLIQGRIYEPARKDEHIGLSAHVTAKQNETSSQYVCKLLSSAPLGIYIVSPSGHIRFISALLEYALGYDLGEIVAQEMTLNDLRYVVNMAFAQDNEWQTLDERVPMHGRVMLRRKNGSLLKSMLRQEISRDAEGNMLMLMGMVDVLDA
jgi:PAS domain-containing protein